MTMLYERVEYRGQRLAQPQPITGNPPWWPMLAAILTMFCCLPGSSHAKIATGGAPPVTQFVEWALLPDGCPPPAGSTEVACGDFGTFFFEVSDPGSCAVASGGENPPAYLEPTHVTYTVQPIQLDPRRGIEAEPRPILRAVGPDLPCAEGSCFEPPGGSAGNEPWLAVVDWDNEHGWTTGWTAITLSGLPAHLYAIDGPDLVELFGPAVGDAHLLARLCEVAEAVDHPLGIPAPMAVNMSFGRLVRDGHDETDGELCEPANLSCQIARLLEYLGDRGVVSAAAAGNYGQLQIPASYDAVLSVGNLDLARFSAQQSVAPAWETPPDSDVLLPGYAVCLEPEAPGAPLWPAPPGSSYASALFTGWMASTLEAAPVGDPTTLDWALRWSSSAGCHVISPLQPSICNPVANQILDRILGNDPTTCWSRGFDIWIETAVVREQAQQGVTQQMPSLVEWVEEGHTPTPESDPCVPCVDDGFNQSLTGDNDNDKGDKVVVPPGFTDLLLDLSASSPLRPFLTLEALHLRVDSDYFPLLDRQRPEDVVALDMLEDAEAAALLIRDGRRAAAPDQQPSLVFVLCEDVGECFWSSVPVLSQE